MLFSDLFSHVMRAHKPGTMTALSIKRGQLVMGAACVAWL